MSVIQELIRQESNGTISFGNYLLDSKKKVLDFEVEGDLYKVKTFKEITKLEKNGVKKLEEDEITSPNLKDNENIKAVITGEVPIPTGEEYVEGTKDTGVVIAFGDSEFVWVPVPEISEMASLQSGSDVNYQGVLYNFSGITATPCPNAPDENTSSATSFNGIIFPLSGE